MATAPPADQLRLLDVQELDTRAQQLAHQRKNLPEHARIAELDAQLEDLRGKLVESRTAVSDLRRELTKAEGDVEQVRTRAARDQSRLDSGQVGAKDAQALVAELESLARRQGVLEEVELDVMERLEAHEEALAKLESAHAELESAKAEVVAARDARYGELDAEAAQVAGRRTDAVAGLDAGLLALYERVRDQRRPRRRRAARPARRRAQRLAEPGRARGDHVGRARPGGAARGLRPHRGAAGGRRRVSGASGRQLVVEADGGSRGNPGPAGFGALVRDAATGQVLAERAAYLGTTTNNVAEYSGLVAGLRAAAEIDPTRA